jgi:hypothetical protein
MYYEVYEMKEEFLKLPAVLQKQVLVRLCLGILAFLAFFIILICSRSIEFSVPCLIVSIILLINGTLLLKDCVNGNYIRIDGICSGIVKSRLHRKIKEVCISANDKMISVPVYKPIRNLKEGTAITLYLSPNTAVYNRADGYVIYNYYAMENNICK